jgi:hypothetical protein
LEDQNRQEWFEAAWEAREESVYRSLFGDIGAGIYTLDPEVFTAQFQQTSIDPRWITHGVFECPPSDTRQSWLYVSSGLSNAWEANSPNANGVSGLGCEFILECVEKSQWALVLLRSMVAFQILLSVGRFPGKGVLQAWDRIPVRAPIAGSLSILNWLLLVPSPRFHGPQMLSSGKFHFLQFVGITEDEATFARNNGGDKLLDLLLQCGAAPVTDPNRTGVLAGTI